LRIGKTEKCKEDSNGFRLLKKLNEDFSDFSSPATIEKLLAFSKFQDTQGSFQRLLRSARNTRSITMNAPTIIAALAVAAAVFFAVRYIIKEKKKGNHCIGCPYAGSCQKKNCGKDD
jgi:hypothetical protein